MQRKTPLTSLAGLSCDTIRFTYPTVDRHNPSSVLSFYGLKDIHAPDYHIYLNDTNSGPEDHPYDISTVKVKLDSLRTPLTPSKFLALPHATLDGWAAWRPHHPESLLLNDHTHTAARDMWDFAEIYANMTAQAMEYENIICGTGTSIERLLRAQKHLGPLPGSLQAKVAEHMPTPVAGMNLAMSTYQYYYYDDSLFDTIKDRHNREWGKETDELRARRFEDGELRDLVALFKACMRWNPEERVRAEEALKMEFFKNMERRE
jgi:hypothetical protein